MFFRFVLAIIFEIGKTVLAGGGIGQTLMNSEREVLLEALKSNCGLNTIPRAESCSNPPVACVLEVSCAGFETLVRRIRPVRKHLN